MTVFPLRRIEGKYEILEKIHEGGMGALYKVRHRLLDEIRVIKILRSHLAQDDAFRTRFLREAQAANQLRHPNITQVYDFVVDPEGLGYIVMEYLQGPTLKRLLGVLGPPDLDFTLEIACQATDALDHLHSKGFVHRDLSPDNFMLIEEERLPRVKLLDLGVAKGKWAEELTTGGMFLGKLRYASPEHFSKEGVSAASDRSDLYSFGLVLYELLTGWSAIEGEDLASLAAGHLQRPPIPFTISDPHGKVPEDLRHLVMTLLKKEPEERFFSAQSLSRSLNLIQQRYPYQKRDLKSLFERVKQERVALTTESTQLRLDEQFGLETTPTQRLSTASRAELAKTRQMTSLNLPLPPSSEPSSISTPPLTPPDDSEQDATTPPRETLPPPRIPPIPPIPSGVSQNSMTPNPGAPSAPPAYSKRAKTEVMPQLSPQPLTPSPSRNQEQATGKLDWELSRRRIEVFFAGLSRQWNRWSAKTAPLIRNRIEKGWRWVRTRRGSAVIAALAVVSIGTWAIAALFNTPENPGIERHAEETVPPVTTKSPEPRAITPPPPLGSWPDLYIADEYLESYDLSRAELILARLQSRGPLVSVAEHEHLRSLQQTFLDLSQTQTHEQLIASVVELQTDLRTALEQKQIGQVAEIVKKIEKLQERFTEAPSEKSLSFDESLLADARDFKKPYHEMWSAQRKKDYREVLHLAAAVLDRAPNYSPARVQQRKAVKELEKQIEQLIARDRLNEALALMQEIEVTGLASPAVKRQIEQLAKKRTRDQRMESILTEARQAGEHQRPSDGLRLLRQTQPSKDYRSPFARLDQDLQKQLEKLDIESPKVAQRGVHYVRDSAATIRLLVIDDYEVVNVRAWARPKRRLDPEGEKFKEVRINATTDNEYVLYIPVNLHQDVKRLEFYVQAFDHSMNVGYFGSRSEPKLIRRGR